MTARTIDHAALGKLVEAGSVTTAQVVGTKGGWSIIIDFGAGEQPLVSQRSPDARVFKRMDTLVSYLAGVGISHFEVDASNHERASGIGRPDRAAALRQTHQAAAYDKWFREQVEIGIREADDPNAVWYSHEEVKQDIARQRAELTARLNGESQ